MQNSSKLLEISGRGRRIPTLSRRNKKRRRTYGFLLSNPSDRLIREKRTGGKKTKPNIYFGHHTPTKKGTAKKHPNKRGESCSKAKTSRKKREAPLAGPISTLRLPAVGGGKWKEEAKGTLSAVKGPEESGVPRTVSLKRPRGKQNSLTSRGKDA